MKKKEKKISWKKASIERRPRLKWILGRFYDQNKSGFFRGPAFIQPIRQALIGWKNPAHQKATFVLIM